METIQQVRQEQANEPIPLLSNELSIRLRWWTQLLWGLIKFSITRKTPEQSCLAMIRLHCITNGFATKLLGSIFSFLNPAERVTNAEGVLGNLTKNKIDGIIKDIEENGYHIFEQKLPESICQEIEKLACITPANLEYNANYMDGGKSKRAVYNPASPISKTYKLPEEELIKNSTIQNLMSDETIRAIAGAYVRANPILCSVNTWWSPVMGGEPGIDAAQLYHFDMSRAKWLNFFIYLTDVDSESGPHCVVRKSHHFKNQKGHELLRRGYARIPDSDIEWAYGSENMIEILGKRGTVVAVDTKCFHKGKAPIKNHRLIFELVYSSSLFGGSYTELPKPAIKTEHFKDALQSNPKTYVRYL